MTSRAALLALLPVVSACVVYQARPLDGADPARSYNERRLDDPKLRVALDSVGVHPAAEGWRDDELAEAAWILRPERARLEAELRVAQAARVTAGARDRPGLVSESEYSFSGTRGESRWGLAVSGVFAVELGGKRGARLARANAGVLLARARADEEAWAVRWQVHAAAFEYAARRRRLQAIEHEWELTDSIRVVLQRQFEDGSIGEREVSRVSAELEAVGADVAAARRGVVESHAAVATAVGVPAIELARTEVLSPAIAGCALAASREELQVHALSARPELRTALAQYQIAEAEVRLEAANSWPDLQFGPGLFFDHGVGKWTIGFGLPSLPRGGNRGAIREAEARREVAAERVSEGQEQVLGDVEQALAGCDAVDAERRGLGLDGALRQRALVEAAYARGESGRWEVLQAWLAIARVERQAADVDGAVAQARLALEHAVGVWEPSAAPGSVEEAK